MIKKASIEDIFFLNKILKESNIQSFNEETLKDMITGDIYNIFIYIKEEPIGLIITWQSDLNAEIIDFVVNKENQNQGIGKKLINYAINDLIKKGINQISLEVRKSNEKAIYLYEKLGFTYDKTINNYYKDEDGLVYRWKK